MDRFRFRLWDNDNECYDYIDFRELSRTNEILTTYEEYFYDGYFEHNQDCIEQCTGLKDKNGNLIYENDVLFDGEFCGQVIWKDGCWLVEMTLYDGDKSYEHLDQHFAKYGEIIGNVHDQKENQ